MADDKKKQEEFKNLFLNLRLTSEDEKRLKGGHVQQEMHGCTGLSVDCFCQPHCVSGKSCTKDWR